MSEDQMEKIMLKQIDIDLQSQGSCFFSKSQDALFYISSRARKALAGWEEGVELYAAKALHACLKEKEPGKEAQALTFQGEPLPEPVTGTVVVRSGHTVFLLMARAEAVEDPSYVGQII